jgi:hypothetical protein
VFALTLRARYQEATIPSRRAGDRRLQGSAPRSRRTEVITYPVQVTQYFGPQSTFWAKISAMAVLGTLPVFLAVATLQRYLVRGISMGAIKG